MIGEWRVESGGGIVHNLANFRNTHHMFKIVQLSIILLLVVLAAACNRRSPCDGFVTAKDLDETDLAKCKVPDYFKYMQQFSLAYNGYRAAHEIPLLPADFTGITWTVTNQIRWVNLKAIDENKADSTLRRPFMNRKDLEWNGNELIYDRTNYNSMDSLNSWLSIEYYLDTISKKVDYRFAYSLSNKYYTYPGFLELSRNQADSVLEAWHLLE